MASTTSNHNPCCNGDHDHDHNEGEFSVATDTSADVDAGRHRRTIFDVTGLCCQSEVSLIEEALTCVEGVDDYAINIAAGTLALYHDGDEERIEQVVDRLRKVGLKSTPRRSVGRAATVDDGPFSAHFWVIVAGALLAGLGAVLRYVVNLEVVSAAVFASAIAVGGFFVFRQALAGVRRRQFNIPILVTIAVIGAGFIGEWFEAATVVILFAFAEWLESRSMARARREIGALMKLAPQKALCVDDDGSIREVDVEEIDVGDRLRVRPGARIPVDAIIEEGRTEVDESTITGESVPVVKSPGDEVYSGTVNGSGAVMVRASQPASRSTLAHIIDAIEEARKNQSSTEQFIDRFARIYTPSVVVAAALVAVLPPVLLADAQWLDWFYRALVFLVIACPCALVISTPIANVAGLARTAREGVLVKGGKFLELMGRIKAMAFDKTGTLTAGRPEVETVHPLGDYDEQRVLLAAARVEADSEHHVGQAIVNAARHRWAPAEFIDRARQISASVGRGIEATIEMDDVSPKASPTRGRVGNCDWLRECGVQISEELAQNWEAMQTGGRTVVGVAIDDELVGMIALRDALRPGARQALEALREQGVRHVFLITGDNHTTARAIGDDLGLGEEAISARLLPAEKVERIEELRRRHRHIAMVGDGVNDAPALAGATVGIAMGAAGTDVALESADVALMGDDLERIARAVEIGRKTTRVIHQNIAIALGLKAIFLVLAVMGIATLWMAIVADMGASLIVIFNAIRLLRSDGESHIEPIREADPSPRMAGA